MLPLINQQFFVKRQLIDDFIVAQDDWLLTDAYTKIKRKRRLELLMFVLSLTFFGGLFLAWVPALIWLVFFIQADKKFISRWNDTMKVPRTTRLESQWKSYVSLADNVEAVKVILVLVMSIPAAGFLALGFIFVLATFFSLGSVTVTGAVLWILVEVRLDNLLVEDINLLDSNLLIERGVRLKAVRRQEYLMHERLVVQHEHEESLRQKELRQKRDLEALISMSSRVKIDDLAELLGEPRSSLFRKLIYWGEDIAVKIDGDHVLFDEEQFRPGSSEFEQFSTSMVSKLPTCNSCGELLDRDTKFCPSCGEEAKICEICKRNVIFGESMAYCPHCNEKHPFHRGHLLEAVKVTKKCPICKNGINENDVIIPVTGKQGKVKKTKVAG